MELQNKLETKEEILAYYKKTLYDLKTKLFKSNNKEYSLFIQSQIIQLTEEIEKFEKDGEGEGT